MIQIQEQTEGKRTGAAQLTLTWLTRDFFNQDKTLRAEFQDSNGFYLTHEDYVFQDDSVSEEVVLTQLGVVKNTEEEL